MLFLQQNSEILCTIVGSWRRSQSLPQGALELPSTLTFAANYIMVSKVEALLVAKIKLADDDSPAPATAQL